MGTGCPQKTLPRAELLAELQLIDFLISERALHGACPRTQVSSVGSALRILASEALFKTQTWGLI